MGGFGDWFKNLRFNGIDRAEVREQFQSRMKPPPVALLFSIQCYCYSQKLLIATMELTIDLFLPLQCFPPPTTAFRRRQSPPEK
jgi:hypothetical protein